MKKQVLSKAKWKKIAQLTERLVALTTPDMIDILAQNGAEHKEITETIAILKKSAVYFRKASK